MLLLPDWGLHTVVAISLAPIGLFLCHQANSHLEGCSGLELWPGLKVNISFPLCHLSLDHASNGCYLYLQRSKGTKTRNRMVIPGWIPHVSCWRTSGTNIWDRSPPEAASYQSQPHWAKWAYDLSPFGAASYGPQAQIQPMRLPLVTVKVSFYNGRILTKGEPKAWLNNLTLFLTESTVKVFQSQFDIWEGNP